LYKGPDTIFAVFLAFEAIAKTKSEIPSRRLLSLNGLEQSLEVTLAKAATPLPLDDLVKDSRPILYGTRKNLQHVALVIPIDEYPKTFKLLNRFVDFTDALLEGGVVTVWNRKKTDAMVLHLGHGRHNVIRRQRHMLNPRPLVEIEVLLNLRLASALRRLVDWKFYV